MLETMPFGTALLLAVQSDGVLREVVNGSILLVAE